MGLYDADVRNIKCKIVVDYTSPFVDQSITATANEQNNMSKLSQTADSILELQGKYMLLDGLGKLDGTWRLPSDSVQTGWWGTSISGEDGLFSIPYPALTIMHVKRPILSVRVIGENMRNEFPVDFDIKMYNSADELVHMESVTGNDSIIFTQNIDAVADVVKQVLEIKKWSHANTSVKIVEFYTSIQEVYYRDDIFDMNILEEREISEGDLPIGSISSNEIDVRIFNENHKFDAGNKESPLYGAVKPNRRIRPYLYATREVLIEEYADVIIGEL